MTAHELARELLDGPDFKVATRQKHFDDAGNESEEDHAVTGAFTTTFPNAYDYGYGEEQYVVINSRSKIHPEFGYATNARVMMRGDTEAAGYRVMYHDPGDGAMHGYGIFSTRERARTAADFINQNNAVPPGTWPVDLVDDSTRAGANDRFEQIFGTPEAKA